MRAEDLASLLLLAAARGPLDLREFHNIFALYDPDEVHSWVEQFSDRAKQLKVVPLGMLFDVLAEIGYAGPDPLTTSVIADRIRMHGYEANRLDIRRVVSGLEVLVPSLIQSLGDDVFLATTPQRLREAIINQIRAIPPQYRFGLDDSLTYRA
jgi:hypothetical protein